MVFSTVLGSCQNKEHQMHQGYVPPSLKKEQISMDTANQRELGTWEGRLSIRGEQASIGIPGREAFSLCFYHGHSLLVAKYPFLF